MATNKNEQKFYNDVSSIEKSLKRIANALEDKQEVKTKDIPLTITNTLSNKDEDYGDDVHNDYLNDLVQGMSQMEFLQFHSQMEFSFASNDATAMSDAIYELEYDECLGAIKQALLITDDEDYLNCAGDDEEAGLHYVAELIKKENTTQSNDDPYTYDNNLTEYLNGVIDDSDYNIRKAAYGYEAALDSETQLTTKKDCILEYVTEKFGSQGARYSDIIKFAYYLGAPNAPKYTSANRGYYSCGFAMRYGGHLITGGKDQFVKGINQDGQERYFALSFVESVTDYFRYLDRK